MRNVKRMILMMTTQYNISTSATSQTRRLEKFKKLQASFQCDDGKPIWLKGGFSDKILYTTTIVLCYVGVFGVLQVLYDQAKPNTWRTPC